jgi:hypothetical protein
MLFRLSVQLCMAVNTVKVTSDLSVSGLTFCCMAYFYSACAAAVLRLAFIALYKKEVDNFWVNAHYLFSLYGPQVPEFDPERLPKQFQSSYVLAPNGAHSPPSQTLPPLAFPPSSTYRE